MKTKEYLEKGCEKAPLSFKICKKGLEKCFSQRGQTEETLLQTWQWITTHYGISRPSSALFSPLSKGQLVLQISYKRNTQKPATLDFLWLSISFTNTLQEMTGLNLSLEELEHLRVCHWSWFLKMLFINVTTSWVVYYSDKHTDIHCFTISNYRGCSLLYKDSTLQLLACRAEKLQSQVQTLPFCSMFLLTISLVSHWSPTAVCKQWGCLFSPDGLVSSCTSVFLRIDGHVHTHSTYSTLTEYHIMAFKTSSGQKRLFLSHWNNLKGTKCPSDSSNEKEILGAVSIYLLFLLRWWKYPHQLTNYRE